MATQEEEFREILSTARTIAVVGLSDRPNRPSHEIASYLNAAGNRIIPVNPRITEALGEKAYPSLREVREPIDVSRSSAGRRTSRRLSKTPSPSAPG